MVRDWFFPHHAKQDLFSATVSDSPQDMRQRAVDKVNLWMFKAGRLPPAILATASLTEAILHDEARKSTPATVISDAAMQSIYAMAFARFVNGFVDRDIARSHAAEMIKEDSTAESDEDMTTVISGKGESSMYAHAATIGMPQEFVDLRHQVTHGDVPSLAYLRGMTAKALEWLWERWWIKNAAGSPDLAIRELEERRRISRDAARASEMVQGSFDTVADGPLRDAERLDVLEEASLAVAGTTSRKRRSSAIDENNSPN
ncbi:rRNA-processing protein las1 [Cladophialophora chaetospira]|uniref:rRNA-processing protein las1 n=1 Tax=Cladophialophora chaetospira TaxID=386627 RepID=A0AA38X045_9EURO|nr:rRNA-processing protein las1 [Cladophialophora chaetospira]